MKKMGIKSSKNYGKWVAEPQKQGDVTTEELARRISENATFRPSEVQGILMELVEQMRMAMQDGYTVVLDDLGRFHLSVEADAVNEPDDFNIQQHVHRVKCKFVAATHRQRDGSATCPLSDGTQIMMQPYYYQDEETDKYVFRRRGKMRS